MEFKDKGMLAAGGQLAGMGYLISGYDNAGVFLLGVTVIALALFQSDNRCRWPWSAARRRAGCATRSGRGVDSGLTADGRRLELAGGHGIERRDRDAGLPLGCFDEQKRTPANPMVAGLADRADRVVLRVASFDAFLAARLRHGTAVRGCRLSLAASFASAACVYALFSGSSALDAAAGCRGSKGLDFE